MAAGFDQPQYQISSNYASFARAFRTMQKLLKLNIQLHTDSLSSIQKTIDQGDIFVFNQFARFETFIPQYLIYRESGFYCRSVASAEHFSDERFAKFLYSIGVVPDTMPGLLPFLAGEILHGRKLILFAENGINDNPQLPDEKNAFGIHTQNSLKRPLLQSDTATIALALDAFKAVLLHDHAQGHEQRLDRWTRQLGFENREHLIQQALKPTCIVPGHISFYPLRINDNLLHQAIRRFKGKINKRFAEEIIVKGNVLPRHTDMDIRFARPLYTHKYWRWWEKKLLPTLLQHVESLSGLFELTPQPGYWGGRLYTIGIKSKSQRVDDDCMHAMHQAVSVNLSHLASYLILSCYRQGLRRIKRERLHTLLYLCSKQIQSSGRHLHSSLLNPEEYAALLETGCERIQQFVTSARQMDLIRIDQAYYQLQDKLISQLDVDDSLNESFISLYASEIAPLAGITRLIDQTIKSGDPVSPRTLAEYRFDDELRAYEWDREAYDQPRHREINAQQKFTEDARPLRLISDKPGAPAVLLIHGFMASPAEMRGLATRLHTQGYHLLAVRLKGHGTSPWDLRDRNWQDWQQSVRRGYELLNAYSPEIHIVGFSTGGLLALQLAADRSIRGPASVISVCAPVQFRNKNMRFVPVLNQANRMVRWVSPEGVVPFRPNITEHPQINYLHVPIRALYQLQKLIAQIVEYPLQIACPLHLFQGDHDPVVEPISVQLLFDHVECEYKQLHMIHSSRHGIVYEDIDHTQQKIIAVVQSVSHFIIT